MTKTVLLTLDQVENWRKERDALEEEIRDKTEKLRSVKLKLDAAEVFTKEPADTPATPGSNGYVVPAPADSSDVDTDEPVSVSQIFLANLRETGDSLKVSQVRNRLVQLGFGKIIETKPNYAYGFVYRLTRAGKLLKRGSRYRAAPIDSSQEETEAVGASVHQ